MPTYEYQCKNCGTTIQEFQSITEPPLTHCPKCNTDSLVRILGGGAGLIFKGTGFYLTDYKHGNTSSSPGTGSKKATDGKEGGTAAPPKPPEKPASPGEPSKT